MQEYKWLVKWRTQYGKLAMWRYRDLSDAIECANHHAGAVYALNCKPGKACYEAPGCNAASLDANKEARAAFARRS